jgi:hypothetical protein
MAGLLVGLGLLILFLFLLRRKFGIYRGRRNGCEKVNTKSYAAAAFAADA